MSESTCIEHERYNCKVCMGKRLVKMLNAANTLMAKYVKTPDNKPVHFEVAGFCYIDHATGDSDHMNAHIETSDCKKAKKP